MAEENRGALKQLYFTVYDAQYPSISNIIIISASSIFGGFFIMYFFQNTIIVGLILIVLGLVLLAMWLMPYNRDKQLFKNRPPDDLMDDWLLEELNTVVKMAAIAELRLDASKLTDENFLIVPYPVFWEGDAGSIRRQGADGAFRYSLWQVQVVALTENYVSIFYCSFDWMSGAVSGVSTNEFFYDDITSVNNDSTMMEQILKETEEEKIGVVPIVKINNLSGEQMQLITGISVLNASSAVMTDSNTVVKAIRIMLRNRRYNEEIVLEIVRNESEEEKVDEEENESDEIENKENSTPTNNAEQIDE